MCAARRFVSMTAFVAVLIWLAGCGGSASPAQGGGGSASGNSGAGSGSNASGGSSAPEALYFGTTDAGGQIFVYTLDPTTGAIGNQAPGSPYQSGIYVPVTFATLANRWLYAIEGPNGTPGPGDVMGFSIDPSTGALSPNTGANPYREGSPDNQASDAGNWGLETLVADPLGRFLFATSQSSIGIAVFRINSSTGDLSETWPPPPANTARNDATAGAAVDSSGSFIYGLSFVKGDLVGYHINADGTLNPVPGSPFAAGSYPKQACHCVVVDPKGGFVYAVSPTLDETNTPDNKIYAFSMDQTTGSLTPLAGSPFATGQAPVSIAITPSGQYVYVANAWSNTITGYRVETNGTLTPIAGSPFNVGSARDITIEPTGRFAYVGLTDISASREWIAVFAIDSSTGALKPTGNQTTGPDWGFSIAQLK